VSLGKLTTGGRAQRHFYCSSTVQKENAVKECTKLLKNEQELLKNTTWTTNGQIDQKTPRRQNVKGSTLEMRVVWKEKMLHFKHF